MFLVNMRMIHIALDTVAYIRCIMHLWQSVKHVIGLDKDGNLRLFCMMFHF